MSFWKDKKVFLTGHTGFKGAWLSIWLQKMGAIVTGYSLEAPTNPSLFEIADIGSRIKSQIGDIRDRGTLQKAVEECQPEIIFHMAAQPLVRDSYERPVETYETNVMGTVNLLEAVRLTASVKSLVIITTDKCYENKEWEWGYRENEPMGGYDPYSNSKACAELVVSSYRNSFFNINNYDKHGVGLATARAGNVIGGGDWAKDRLVPDCMNALSDSKEIVVRNPYAIRPWQHVLESLNGYLKLAEKLYSNGPEFASAWNFGPYDVDVKPVGDIVKSICSFWGDGAKYLIKKNLGAVHEAKFLKLDCSKSRACLDWQPVWNLDRALREICSWYKLKKVNEKMYDVCLSQIKQFEKDQEELINGGK